MACAYSIRLSRNLIVKRCGAQCKWNDLNPMESRKRRKTVSAPTQRVSVIYQADSKADLSNTAQIFACNSHHRGVDDRDMRRQSRIRPFEVHKHLEQTAPEVSVQRCEHRHPLYEEI
jgi:hypothetical protein